MVCALVIAPSGHAEAESISLAWDSPPEQVTSYIVHYGTQSSVYTQNVDVGNVTSYVVTALTTGQVYYFVVQAYNSAGTSPFSEQVSGPADPPPPACTFTISPGNVAVVAGGGAGSVAVTTGSGCDWTATTSAPWITITAGATGSGSGTVNYSVAPNATTSSRTGTVTIGGQTIAVTQDGAAPPCTFSISPVTVSVGSDGGAGTVTVSTTAGCNWTASSNASWLTVTEGASGSGNGTVTYAVAATTASSARTGTLTIAGESVTVTQDAASYATAYTLTILADEYGMCPNGPPGQDPDTITTRLSFRGRKGKKLALDKKDKIFLLQSGAEDMEVLDGNACDGDGASFVLPPNGTNATVYAVWVKAFGGLEVNDQFTTCGIDTSDNTLVCSTENALRLRNKPHQRNVTTALTTITGDFDTNLETADETLGLFDDALYGYFWDYDDSGFRRIQLRFYPEY